MARIWKIAFIGTGNMAQTMAKTVSGLENFEAYGVAARDPQRAREFARKWNFTRYYDSYEELAADPEIDLVYISTVHSMHYSNAKLCMEHGKNVLIEKAFTVNSDEARELIELSREKGVFLAEAIWTRYMPGLQIIRQLIADGRIGDVDFVEAELSVSAGKAERFRRPELGGGALLDTGVYTLTFASLFLGDDVVSTRSRCIPFSTGVDATSVVELTYRDGRQAFLRQSMVEDYYSIGRINGTRGRIEVHGINGLGDIRIFDGDGELVEKRNPSNQINGYEYELLACVKAIEAGKLECAEMPHAQTLRIMEQMSGLHRSWGIELPSGQ